MDLEKWVFEVDREVANKLGPEGILEVLDRMKSVDPKANPSTRLAHFLAFWSPSINDRVSELRNPQPITLPKRSRISRIGLRWRFTIVGIGVDRQYANLSACSASEQSSASDRLPRWNIPWSRRDLRPGSVQV